MPYYRFSMGNYVKADTFEEARSKLIKEIEAEIEDLDSWHACTCTGLSHRFNCPEQGDEVPF